MSYDLRFIMNCPGRPCKSEIYESLDECFDRVKALHNLHIRWYDFRIQEVSYQGPHWRWKESYLVELYNRRNRRPAKCGS